MLRPSKWYWDVVTFIVWCVAVTVVTVALVFTDGSTQVVLGVAEACLLCIGAMLGADAYH